MDFHSLFLEAGFFWGDGLLFVVAFGEIFVGGGGFRGGVSGGLWWWMRIRIWICNHIRIWICVVFWFGDQGRRFSWWCRSGCVVNVLLFLVKFRMKVMQGVVLLSWVMSNWWWCSLRVVIFRSKVMVYSVDGDFGGCWWWVSQVVVYGVELGGEMFTVSFLCGGEFGGVAMMMMRSLWVALCWVLWFSFLRVLCLRLLRKKRLFGVFVWWWFPYDPDLCGGGDGGVKLWCRPHFWWCEEVPVGLQRLGSIRTFSFGLTTLLSGGLSIWIDGVAVVKVDFVVALVVVVVAKVDSLRCHWLWLWRRWLLLFQSL